MGITSKTGCDSKSWEAIGKIEPLLDDMHHDGITSKPGCNEKSSESMGKLYILCLEIRDSDGFTSKPGCDDNSLYALYKIDRY